MTTSYREPDVLDDTYDDKSDYLTIIKNILTTQAEKYSDKATFKTTMQEDYNEMIESVKTYGGFYVGRYEMGLEENGETKKATSKKGDATDATTGKANRWYGLYAYGKTYSNTQNSVKSSMIWGSQYDAMLNYALTGSDKARVTAKTYSNHNGNALDTGSTEGDQILNIFDLEGNHREWTLEAQDNDCRVSGGSGYNGRYSPSNRDLNLPNYTLDDLSSRLTLYVK